VEYVPLPDLFDLPRLLAWFQRRPLLTDYLTRVNAVASALRKYEVPAYIVQDAEPEILQDIFDRMNSYGKRLSRAEIFSALSAPIEGTTGGLTLAGIAESVEADLSFGRVDEDTVLHVLLAARGSVMGRDIRNELSAGERSAAYALAQQALRQAVGFLQSAVGVPHISFLPYRYLLVVVARFLTCHPDPAPRNRELLVRWYWRAAMTGPDKGSATGTMGALVRRVSDTDENASIQALLDYVRDRPLDVPSAGVFNSRTAGTRILLGALWSRQPRSIVSGEPISPADLAAALAGQASANEVAVRVVRRENLPKAIRLSAGNRLLIGDSAGDGRTLRESLESLDPFRDEQVLQSHLIDAVGLELLRNGDQEEFVARREEQIDLLIQAFLAQASGRSFEDTPPLASLVLDEDEDDPSGQIHAAR
jgi:hypothetical protein